MLRGPPAVMICTMSKLAKVTMSENSTVMAMMLRIIGSVMWTKFLPGIGAVDRRRFIELFRHRFERRQIHDQKERRAVPDIDQDDGKARPIRIAQPGDFARSRAR